ncbi:WD40-repeat-containing domain protein [Umbelopsis sp. PMI_123]|nr:WD40-repeat-containing domain protein [Umbelopsis sp. PMI_123]
MSLTSEEINYLVFRYLQESGFRYSSYTFQHESQIHKSEYRNANVQPGALVDVLHKGLQYIDIETHLDEDGNEIECDVPMTLLGPHRCEVSKKGHKRAESVSSALTTGFKRERKEDKKNQKDRDKRVRKDNPQSPSAGQSIVNGQETTTNGTDYKEEGDGDDVVMADADQQTNSVIEIASSEALILTGHQNEVFSCAWNPQIPLMVASGSGDATARLWQVPAEGDDVPEPIVLNHLPNLNDNKDVTTLDWNPSGTLLATGSYDGQARIWTPRGELRCVMTQHRGPIFSLKWNKKGDLLLSGSADNTTVVWNPETGDMKQQFELHKLAILDVDWMDDTTFASCSTDQTIRLCKVGSTKPLRTWHGHEDEVNAVRWDPTGEWLASCSDDTTAKIWSPDSDQCVQEIRGHELQIYTLQWAPYFERSGPDASPRILATGSFDATIRIWDALRGTCLHVLKNHTEAVYSISFSPDARLLCSGSFDEMLNIWDAKKGTLLKTYKGNGGIFEVHFNKTGEKLAACTSSKQVVILDMKS